MKKSRQYFYLVWVMALATVGGFLKASPVTQENYFFVGFAYQDGRNSMVGSHTFGSFYKVVRGNVQDRVDISWLPARQRLNPRDGVPPVMQVDGQNYDLEETLGFAEGKYLAAFGPFQISRGMYERAQRREAYLRSGLAEYKMLPTFLRPLLRMRVFNDDGRGVLNCIMAVSDISGQLFTTGTAHGISATQAVVQQWAPFMRRLAGRDRMEVMAALRMDRVLPSQVIWQ